MPRTDATGGRKVDVENSWPVFLVEAMISQ